MKHQVADNILDKTRFGDLSSAKNTEMINGREVLENGESLTLWGEVYVHGMMYGEAFKDGNAVKFKKVRIH